jgi:hypothetical protein
MTAPLRTAAALGAALLLSSACAGEADPGTQAEDAELDSFLQGKADGLAAEVPVGIEACAVLRTANRLDEEALIADVGLAERTTANLLAHRAGPDGVLGTSDDDPSETLAELDAIPYVGRIALKLLREYAADAGMNAGCAGTVGVTYDDDTGKIELRAVDPLTLASSKIADLNVGGQLFQDYDTVAEGLLIAAYPGSATQAHLVDLDPRTGAITSRALLSGWYPDWDDEYHGFNWGAGFHARSDGATVGVTWNHDEAREEVRVVDPATLASTFLGEVPIAWTSGAVSDPEADLIYVRGYHADQARVPGERLFVIDAEWGALLASPALGAFTYDPETGTYHGFNWGGGFHVRADGALVSMTWNGEEGREELRSFDPRTGASELIAVIPGLAYHGGVYHDRVEGVLRVRAYDANVGDPALFSIDTTTGEILATPPIRDGGESNPRVGFGWHGGFFALAGDGLGVE